MPTHRERALAVLNYAAYDRLPVLHFGFWRETLMKWAMEGHLSQEEALGAAHIVDFSAYTEIDRDIESRLGFDFDWENIYPGEGTRGSTYFPGLRSASRLSSPMVRCLSRTAMV